MWRKLLLIALGVVLILCAVSLVTARAVIERAAKGKTYSDVSVIPHRHVGLVPGCPKKVAGGYANPFFEYRMDAAAQLYFSGKVDYLVVSGDNHVQSYDEPVDMKYALVQRGVPANRIYLDYAGFRTLDSVVRVKEIFGQENITIVSQNFQNERAIFLAQHHGIDAIGFDAADVAPQYAAKTLLREQFARVKAILDVYVFHKQPHFLGLKIAIAD
jgi:SanA protein